MGRKNIDSPRVCNEACMVDRERMRCFVLSQEIREVNWSSDPVAP